MPTTDWRPIGNTYFAPLWKVGVIIIDPFDSGNAETINLEDPEEESTFEVREITERAGGVSRVVGYKIDALFYMARNDLPNMQALLAKVAKWRVNDIDFFFDTRFNTAYRALSLGATMRFSIAPSSGAVRRMSVNWKVETTGTPARHRLVFTIEGVLSLDVLDDAGFSTFIAYSS